MSRPRAGRDMAGFTLVELVVTMVIIGIMAFVALPRFDGLGAYDARGAGDQLAAYLRYAQKSALAQRRHVSVTVIDAGTEPTMVIGASCGAGTTLKFPGKFAIPKSVVGVVVTGANPICFDTLGGAATTTAIKFSGGGLDRNVTVEPVTGFVHAS